MKNLFTFLIMVILSLSAYAQDVISGTIVDDKTNEPLIGATVAIEGTSIGTVTDVMGKFTLRAPESANTLIVKYIGYEDMMLPLSKVSMGPIGLTKTALGLDEVVVTGVMDIVKDRRTPVAVSTITKADIQAKSGNVEFPELMKNTPSIYVANQAGGFGDSQVFTRGFDQTNTAFLLNGQPINGMEDGKMYWSNWSGMSDIANAIQVQRGLGSSKLAISSVGGTTNIIMRATDQQQGGSAQVIYGNDNYIKGTISYSTGMIDDKFGVSVLLSHWQGDGWAEGTQGQGQNYFISAGYKINQNHSLNFLVTGAPQWHDQNYEKPISSYYNNPNNPDDINLKFNSNWGELDGEYYSLRRNYYHKPVANLNWEWSINEKSSLATVLYGSWGRGGGSGDIGSRNNRIFTDKGHLDWDAIEAANIADNGSEEFVVRNSVNNHAWYGVVTNFEHDLTEYITLNIGVDGRTYHGSHFRELRDLMGAPAYTQRANARFGEREVTQTFEANPWAAISDYADQADQIAYSNDETISYIGGFTQIEYATDKFTAFVQGAISNQSHVRFELFNETEENEESEKVNNLGYNAKTGLSYSPDQNNTFFVNTGYYQRQPFHDNIYLNFSNQVNPVTEPEEIIGFEGGYKYADENFALNANVYRTIWNDRITTRTFIDAELPDGTILPGESFRNSIQNQIHQGFELDLAYRANKHLKFNAYTSIGDWKFDGDLSLKYFDEDRKLRYEEEGADVSDINVGGAAQTSFGMGVDLNFFNALMLTADYNYYDRLYSNLGVGLNSLELPSFGILDLGASYMFNLASSQALTLRANVFNALGKEYISQASSAIPASSDPDENWNGVNRENVAIFGQTMTWNVSLKYSF